MNPVLKAAIWMIGAIASFSTMAVAGREVSFALDTFEIMLFRSFVGVVIVIAAASVFGTWHQVNRQQFSLHFARNIMHFIGQNLWFYAVTVIPLAQVFALEFTSPIWVILLSPFIVRGTHNIDPGNCCIDGIHWCFDRHPARYGGDQHWCHDGCVLSDLLCLYYHFH